MQNFLKTLTSESKNAALPEEFNFFGKLIGSWKIDYIDNSNSRLIQGESAILISDETRMESAPYTV